MTTATLFALPIERNFRGAPPLIFLTDGSLDAAPGAGDRVLAKIEPTGEGAFLAKPFKTLPRPRHDIVVGRGRSRRHAPPHRQSAPSMILSLASKIGARSNPVCWVRAEVVWHGAT